MWSSRLPSSRRSEVSKTEFLILSFSRCAFHTAPFTLRLSHCAYHTELFTPRFHIEVAMASYRLLRLASRIKFLVSTVIQREIQDPRMGMVTVLNVELTGDLREAMIQISIFGKPGVQSRTMTIPM